MLLFGTVVLNGIIVNAQNGTTSIGDPAASLQSGFYDHYGSNTLPYESWWHIITQRHVNVTNDYSLQLIANFWNENDIFFRLNNGPLNYTRGALKRIWHSGNFNPEDYWKSTGGWLSNFGTHGFTRKIGSHFSGGEFSLLEKNAQMSVLIDGSYYTGEAGGFYALNEGSEYESRVGFTNSNGVASFNSMIASGTSGWGFSQSNIFFTGVGGNIYSRGFSTNAMGIFNGSTTKEDIFLYNQNSPTADFLVLKSTGNVGIGTSDPGTYRLAVEGTIGARKIKVTQGSWADYVFKPEYKLRPLSELEAYIKKYKHLPDVPSEQEVLGKDMDISETQVLLLKKIEELTLYIIQQQKEIDQLKKKNK